MWTGLLQIIHSSVFDRTKSPQILNSIFIFCLIKHMGLSWVLSLTRMDRRSHSPERQFLFRLRLPFIQGWLNPKLTLLCLLFSFQFTIWNILLGVFSQRAMQVLVLQSWVVGAVWSMPVPAVVRRALTQFSHKNSGILTKASSRGAVSCALEILMVCTSPGAVWDLFSLFRFCVDCIQITAIVFTGPFSTWHHYFYSMKKMMSNTDWLWLFW